MSGLRLVALALAVFGLVWLGIRILSGPEPEVPAVAGSLPRPPAVRPEPAPRSAAPELLGLRGTEPSSGLSIDAAGHFVPGPEAILFFEYFLSASNEATVSELTESILSAIRARLSPPADAEAAVFLADYLEYLDAGDSNFRAPGVAESADLERRFQWVRELRREHFGPELAERLFGEEEQAGLLHLERQRIRNDETLDPTERAARLEALEASYPESMGAEREQATAPLRHAREERVMRGAGVTEDDIRELREARFGPDAAERMRALDEQRSEWTRRVGVYTAKRDALLAESSGSEAAYADLDALRAEHFTEDEMRRIEILDRAAVPSARPSPATP